MLSMAFTPGHERHPEPGRGPRTRPARHPPFRGDRETTHSSFRCKRPSTHSSSALGATCLGPPTPARAAEAYLLPVRTRMPLKFGPETLTEVTLPRVR